MADSQFDILIKFGLSKEKAGEAVAELKKIGQEGVKQEQAVEEATNKATSAKNRFKEALKGGGREFPAVASAARLAMNPITLAVGVLALAVREVIGHFAELARKVEESRTKLEALKLEKLNAIRDAAIGAGTGMAKFNDELARAGESKDPLRGRKFSSPEEELSARQSLQADLESSAAAATSRAETFKNNPNFKAIASAVAEAIKSQPELLRAANTAARGPTTKEILAAGALGEDPKEFLEKRRGAARKALADYQANETRITTGQESLAAFGIGSAKLESAAAAKRGLATGNLSAMTSTREGIAENERQRRASLMEQLQAGGFGLTESHQMVGASAADVRRSNGERVTGMDAVDYNSLLAQVKASMAKSFLKSLQEVFADGIVSREEINQVTRDLNHIKQQ